MTIQMTTLPCTVCHKTSTVEMTAEQHRLFTVSHEHVQDIFPDWSPAKRELLITGTHGDCWDKMFAENDYEDYDEGQDYLKDTF